MRKILTLAIFAALLIFVGCESEVTLETPDVTYTVTNDGADLSLSWTEVTDADGYIIYADGDSIAEVTTTSYVVTTPAALIEVTAYSGDAESDADQIDCAPVTTTSITVYGMSDTASAHPSGLNFAANGQGTAMSVQTANYPDIDYIFEDRASMVTDFSIVSPGDYTSPVINGEKNMAVETSAASFADLTIADAPGGYSTQTALSANAIYALFMDPDDDGWDTDSDHFGKMETVSITGTTPPYTAVINVAYQPITGLRWVVTP